MMKQTLSIAIALLAGLAAGNAQDHRHDRNGQHPPQRGGEGGPPRLRQHTATQVAGELALVPATREPVADNRYQSEVVGQWRHIKANAIATHPTGPFPNRGNPHAISEQRIDLKVPAFPELAEEPQAVHDFGWTVEGVPFDPGAAEYYRGDRSLGWRYEALSGAVRLGLDESHAHVQPQGKYHYHGLPTLLMENLGVSPESHSPLIGWAADGFPIYALYGYGDGQDENSPIVENTSSYQLKSGARPSGGGNPGGTYDGTFSADYEYVAGSGTLDECNGRFTQTPDFPDGTYAYFLTANWPVVPRMVHGTPDASALRKGPRNR